MTGYDFDPSTIAKRDVNEVISEDDQPLNRVSDEAAQTRKLISPLRANMFEWLPKYDDDLGNHFGYRRDSQSGPLKHGETYSFYSANLERRYGETYPESYMDTWRDVTVKRMTDWGFTSLGNWAQQEYYANKKIPFVAFVDINGDFGTVSSGFDFWHPLPDPFDPVFYDRALVSAMSVAEQIKASPWCMGIFYDNEQSFGRPDSDASHYGIIINTLTRDGNEVFTKAAFTKLMKERYTTIDALNKAWEKSVTSWEEFDKGMDSTLITDTQRQDYSDLLFAYGDQYFGTIRRANKAASPNHLYLGARMADWGRPDEIVRAAAKNTDILSFNLYKEGVKASHWAILDEVDKPTLIGEFGFGADDAGHVHPGIVLAADQKDRGRKYKKFMNSVIDNPYFIGAHMFQYMDGPITGRAYDGENYNFGIVTVTDIPYAPLVKAAKEVHSSLYQRRYGKITKSDMTNSKAH
jgi:agarase